MFSRELFFYPSKIVHSYTRDYFENLKSKNSQDQEYHITWSEMEQIAQAKKSTLVGSIS